MGSPASNPFLIQSPGFIRFISSCQCHSIPMKHESGLHFKTASRIVAYNCSGYLSKSCEQDRSSTRFACYCHLDDSKSGELYRIFEIGPSTRRNASLLDVIAVSHPLKRPPMLPKKPGQLRSFSDGSNGSNFSCFLPVPGIDLRRETAGGASLHG